MGIFCTYFIQHCFICRTSDSTVSEDAWNQPRAVATLTLTLRPSNHTAKSYAHGKISSTHQSYLCNFVGVVLEAHKRIQVNVHLKASLVTGFEKVQEVRYYLIFILYHQYSKSSSSTFSVKQPLGN
jgi:hypothetical protein